MAHDALDKDKEIRRGTMSPDWEFVSPYGTSTIYFHRERKSLCMYTPLE